MAATAEDRGGTDLWWFSQADTLHEADKCRLVAMKTFKNLIFSSENQISVVTNLKISALSLTLQNETFMAVDER